MTAIDRRKFLKLSGGTAGGAVIGSTFFQALGAAAGAQTDEATGRAARPARVLQDSSYGPLSPVPDQRGIEVLALPAGFSYVTFSRTGDRMADGTPVPRNHDGMAAFAGPRGRGSVRLIRNHENRNAPGDFTAAVMGPEATRFDPLGGGGTTSIDYDPVSKRFRDFVSLNGTIVNCAGGIAYRNVGWITCEETVAGPAQGWTEPHGYCFLVPVEANAPVPAEPLTAMGRFAHEAVAHDPRTGFVYETEDSGNDSGFYRFRPVDPADLTAGGTLEVLAVAGQPNYNTLTGQTEGQALPVRWVPIDDPDPDIEAGEPQVAAQGVAGGAALFNRLEGIWFDAQDRSFFFASTSGGDAGYGQIWNYKPGAEVLRLFFESPGGSVLDSPDNLLVTPRGGVLLCEDDASGADNDTHPLAPGIVDVNRLIGIEVRARAEAFEFAVNRLNDSEFAGACFSPDGEVLFVNIFGNASPDSGLTCAITGPWANGPL